MPLLKPLSGSTEAPQQHKQPSRKGKKAWRKNVDVSEVTEGLDALNKEIISGGVTAEKASEDLFTIDTVGQVDIPRKRAAKTLKSEEIIAQRSAVPAVALRKRPAKTSDGILPVKRQRRDAWVTTSEVARLRKVADGQHESTIALKDASYDLWAAPPPKEKLVVEREEENFIPPKEVPKIPKSLRLKPVSLAASGKVIPAVAKPTGGYSYNPLFEDYANRLQIESDKAVEAEQKRLDKEEEERLREEARARSAAEADAAEARAQLSEWDEDSAWEGFDTDAEDVITKKRPKRKTVVQRNRVNRRKAEEGLKKHEASMKARDKQAEHIREIASEVAEREAFAQALMVMSDSESSSEETAATVAEVQLRRKKLGKMKLPEADLELVLPDELQDSLRLLKPEGNLLKDRYRSLLLRGKVETRRRIPFRKKPNVKFTEKWSYKDFRI
ncbi:p60 domain-containing protein [Plectosphaerella plurivora]|uniref:Ribosome biogenesis protein NOP53 n=1 Tax=Plectosphaerella plurivora TaxID=936078 RepID=A0A9P8V0Q5_9PEZI|nr:p60 domain-containing protein [Plectosphaerella plurivora]